MDSYVQKDLFDTGEPSDSSVIEKLTDRYRIIAFRPLAEFKVDWKVPEKYWLSIGRSEDSDDPQQELF